MLHDKKDIQNLVETHTQSAINELVLSSLKSKIKLVKSEYNLTKFIRENICVFMDIVENTTPYHIEFIHRFLLGCGIKEQKNTITTVYNRIKKTMTEEKQKTIFLNKDTTENEK